MKLSRVMYLTLVLICATGCRSGGAPISYYLIDPVNSVALTQTPGLSIEIRDLHVPQYLERFQIAMRSGSNQLVFSDNHQWAESLQKNLMRTTARNFATLLNTADIGTPLTRSSNRADYVVEIYIDQFDQSTVGEVVFAGHFQIIGGKPYKVFATQSFSLSGAKVGRGDYPTMVASMQKLLFEVCNSAAAEILLAEQGTKLK